MSERLFQKVGEGGEAEVFAHTRDGRKGFTVVKVLEGDLSTTEDVNERFQVLREFYGEEFFVPQKARINDDGHLCIIQVDIDLKTAKNLEQVSPETLEEKTKEHFLRLAEKLRQAIDVTRHASEESFPLMDAHPENIYVLPNGSVKYIDTHTDYEVLAEFYKEDSKDGADLVATLSELAHIEILGGKAVEDILADSWYAPLCDALHEVADMEGVSYEEIIRRKPPERLFTTLYNDLVESINRN